MSIKINRYYNICSFLYKKDIYIFSLFPNVIVKEEKYKGYMTIDMDLYD